MGGCFSNGADPGDRKVKQDLEHARCVDSQIIKLLLLGAGGSGKSTLFKQLQYIHCNGFTSRQRKLFIVQIHEQIIESMKILICKCEDYYYFDANENSKFRLYDYDDDDELMMIDHHTYTEDDEDDHNRNHNHTDSYHQGYYDTTHNNNANGTQTKTNTTQHKNKQYMHIDSQSSIHHHENDNGTVPETDAGKDNGRDSDSDDDNDECKDNNQNKNKNTSARRKNSSHSEYQVLSSSVKQRLEEIVGDNSFSDDSIHDANHHNFDAQEEDEDEDQDEDEDEDGHGHEHGYYMHENEMEATESKSQLAAEKVLTFRNFRITGNKEMIENLRFLWHNHAIQAMYEIRNEICVPDSTQYFFTHLDRISASDYVPSDRDLLMVRYRTVGMQEKSFKVKGHSFMICDVGGQRNERRKWIHFFDNVTSILFVVSLSAYDEIIFESEDNAMMESMKVFREQITSHLFLDTPFILFLNKSDLFVEKIKSVPITVAPCFQSYGGSKLDAQASLAYMKAEFTAMNGNTRRSIFTHVTCATDRTQIEKVFNDVQTMIINWSLEATGLM